MTILMVRVISLEKNLPHVVAHAESLQSETMILGSHNVQESCQKIREASKAIRKHAEGDYGRQKTDPVHVEDEIGSLRHNVACARSAMDHFYNAT